MLSDLNEFLSRFIKDTAAGVCDMREKVKECLLDRMKYSRNLQITLTEIMLHKYFFFLGIVK